MSKQFFTLATARQLLPVVRDLVGTARQLSEEMARYANEVKGLSENAAENTGSPAGTLYLQHVLNLQTCLRQLQELGVLIKSVEEGLVDFPCLNGDREVYLCWKYGEENIEYWHEVDAGFAGRLPVSDLEESP